MVDGEAGSGTGEGVLCCPLLAVRSCVESWGSLMEVREETALSESQTACCRGRGFGHTEEGTPALSMRHCGVG